MLVQARQSGGEFGCVPQVDTHNLVPLLLSHGRERLVPEDARVGDEDVGPVAFLVDDAGEGAAVVVPGCGGLAGEALDTAEGCVLCGDPSQLRDAGMRYGSDVLEWSL